MILENHCVFKCFQHFHPSSNCFTYLQILVTLAAAASATPQIVPYVHEEIPAEPYVHDEPEISPLSLGIVRPGASSYQQAAPALPLLLQDQLVMLLVHGLGDVITAWELVCPAGSSETETEILQRLGRVMYGMYWP